MDPRGVFCHNEECPARGKVGQGNIKIHSRKDRRYRCAKCGRTFAETKGTAMYRLHKPSELFFLVLTLLSHGCPVQAVVAAFGLDERTVADWLGKAGKHCRSVHQHLVRDVELGCVQADELRVRMVGRRVWMAMAVAVPSRLWLGGTVSRHRDRHLVGSLARMVRAAALSPCVLVLTDGLRAYVRAFRRTWKRPVRTGKVGRPRLVEEQGLLLGQAVKRYDKRRVVGVVHRAAVGTLEAIEAALGATGSGGVINTAYIERLNATFRARLVVLVRRTRCLARRQELLEAGMWLVGGVYNLCTPHHSLRVESGSGHRWQERTPAMAAGLTDHVWKMEELLRYQVPLLEWVAPRRRGRPPKQSQQPARRLAA
jgi:transposase-like protein/IS1 family transposase